MAVCGAVCGRRYLKPMVTRKFSPTLMGIRENVDVESRRGEEDESNCRESNVDSLMMCSGMTVHGKELKRGILYGDCDEVCDVI